jgi:membrane protease YdiL (CAAX protease family)
VNKKVWAFLGLAYGWAYLIGGALALLHIPLDGGLGLVIVALLYMPAPALAALLVERGPIWARFHLPRGEGWRGLARFIALPAFLVLGFTGLLAAGTALLGDAASATGVGALVRDTVGLRERLASLVGPEQAAAAQLPRSLVPVVLSALVGGVIAGWTLNGLFALGEEYGWRGLLWEELRPRGVVAANLISGVAWGCGTSRSSCGATTTRASPCSAWRRWSPSPSRSPSS